MPTKSRKTSTKAKTKTKESTKRKIAIPSMFEMINKKQKSDDLSLDLAKNKFLKQHEKQPERIGFSVMDWHDPERDIKNLKDALTVMKQNAMDGKGIDVERMELAAKDIGTRMEHCETAVNFVKNARSASEWVT